MEKSQKDKDEQSERKKETKLQALQHGRSQVQPAPGEKGTAVSNVSASPGEAPQKGRRQVLRNEESPVTEPTSEESPGDDPEDNDGLDPEERKTFLDELRHFFKERGADFRIPKFYSVPVNLLKLWKIVCYYGGYDRVTSGKLWRAVGDHFNPPKSCTTLSWSFRIFYEKALLGLERVQGVPDRSELGTLPTSLRLKLDGRGRGGGASDPQGMLCGLPPASGGRSSKQVESGSQEPRHAAGNPEAAKPEKAGKNRRSESGDPVAGLDPHAALDTQEHNRVLGASRKRHDSGDASRLKAEEGLVEGDNQGNKRAKKSVGETTQKQLSSPVGVKLASAGEGAPTTAQLVTPPSEQGHVGKGKIQKGKKPGEAASLLKELQQDPSLQQPAVVWDIGEECSWVKVNVRRSHDCFEIYALVPGLLREEIKVQVEGPGRVVIAGFPEREENPWGVKRFKKIVVLPGTVVAAETTAVVALHGQLYVHLPLANVGEKQNGI